MALARAHELAEPLGIDPAPLLERVPGGAGWRGRRTRGGSGRLVEAADGWLAVNLPRPDDLESVPAWLEVGASTDPWAAIEAEVPQRKAAELIERAALLSLPVAAVGEVRAREQAVVAHRVGEARPLTEPPLVVDLSALWAGPLCTRLLADRGATVVKVETPARPDGARAGDRELFDRLDAGKEAMTCELGSSELADLLAGADVVVEGSRPRALRQAGIVAGEVPAKVWVSITGYGRAVDRVAFGDDAAAAGGLVGHDASGEPLFLGDAIADPLTGIAAAAAVVDALASDGRWLLDAAMAGVAAYVAQGG